ncbi:MAG TPA: proton-conducting transporter membrane subunit [Solirubrobacteraceae bacterium]|nr:proton-conducting transporter membrane subunit [Solirubrobacteraceae bacterium]
MDWLGAFALAGAGVLALGGVTAARPRRLGAGLATQAVGTGLLGLSGAGVLFGDQAVGAAFRSDVEPALGLDPLSGFFLLVLAITVVPALVFARGYLPGTSAARAVGALTSAFLLALVGMLAARDVTTFLAFWELMTLVPAAAIIAARRDAPVRASVYAYLAITHLGGAGVWIALLTLARHGAIGDPAALAAQGTGAQTLVAVAAVVGFGTKAGFIPLHSWLPRAHPVAPAHLSAVMSGVMIKVAIYGLIRVEFEWLGSTPRWLGLALLAVGLLSALGGVLWALVQHDLKRLLAFHSIENVGIIALGLGASLLFAQAGARGWAAIAFAAALLHVANHALFKALLFLGAGAFERAVGALELDRLGGLLRRMPWTGSAFLLGSMAIAGLPPLNGFASEWLTLQSLLHLALEPPLGVALAGGIALAGLAATAALALLCFVKVIGLVLLGPPRRPECAVAGDPPISMRVGMAALAASCVGLGVLPGLVVPTLAGLAPGAEPELLARHAGLDVPGTGSLPTLALAVALLVLTAVLVRARGSRRAAPAPTWACGQPVVAALSWTSAGFTKPLRLVLESLLRPRRELEVVEEGGLVQRVTYASEVPALADRALYEPTIRAGLRGAAIARRLQTGNVRTYALYLLALVLGLLALARVGALG